MAATDAVSVFDQLRRAEAYKAAPATVLPSDTGVHSQPASLDLLLPGDFLPTPPLIGDSPTDFQIEGDVCRAGVAGVQIQLDAAVTGRGHSIIQNTRKWYMPHKGDLVIGIVLQKSSEDFFVDINASSPAVLGCLSFPGSSKQNHPRLAAGSILLCQVSCATVDYETELTCITAQETKTWSTGQTYLGELQQGGLVLAVSLAQAESYMSDNCFLFDRLGELLAYEAVVGHNGRIWIKSESHDTTIKIACLVDSCYGRTAAEVEAFIQQKICCVQSHKK
eukprot:GHVQ01029766.1.p1 GENE.GHVQ01029766.1~~GHVQ01029766.1.p1  ORF type:complete len:278 (-),score=49.30 GHVQ01029766.1:508-1341(-)